MRALLLIATLVATPAFACPMADAAAFADAQAKVQAASGTKVTLTVDGMHCGSCAEKVIATLNGVSGVTASASDYQSGRTVVAYDASKVKPTALVDALKKAGWTAAIAPST